MSAAVTPFEVLTPAGTLRGERSGEGRLVVCVHGLTATRRYVLHGSRALERSGFEVATYDARGHGESEPATDGAYDYVGLAADLDAVIDELAPGGEGVLLAGHSMGAHTIARFALDHPERAAAIVLIGPVYPGFPASEEVLKGWDALSDGLEEGGVDGFMQVYERREWPAQWRDTVLRITRERLVLHRDLGAVAQALRGVPRSDPVEDLGELISVGCPALVVASHDDADSGHPYAIAERWADALPEAQLTSEAEGQSPLAWQGGRLSRVLADFFSGVA